MKERCPFCFKRCVRRQALADHGENLREPCTCCGDCEAARLWAIQEAGKEQAGDEKFCERGER